MLNPVTIPKDKTLFLPKQPKILRLLLKKELKKIRNMERIKAVVIFIRNI